VKTQFKVGDAVVHMSHGMGKIIDDISMGILGEKQKSFLVLEIQDGDDAKRVFVPTESAGAWLRKPIQKSELKKIYSVLSQKGEPDIETWNRRFRSYMEKMSTGKTESVAEVLRDLNAIKKESHLSFGERKLFDQALQMLCAELSISEGVSIEAVEEKIANALSGEK